jgi:hypothetical protein
MRPAIALVAVPAALALALGLPAAARAEDERPADVHPVKTLDSRSHGPCEEPDFAFLSSTPYTGHAGTPEVFLGAQLGVDGDVGPEGKESARELVTTARVEVGITDDLELAAAFGYALEAVKLDGEPFEVADGLLDTTVELRYRFLDEKDAPLNFTAGPLLILPTGKHEQGFGLGRVGWGLEAAAGRDFGRVYVGAWIQRVWTYEVLVPEERGLDLHTLQYSLSVIGKLLERRDAGGSLSHLHGYLEVSAARNTQVSAAEFTPDPSRERGIEAYAVAPGISYGVEAAGGEKVDVGLSFPIGLNAEADDWGAIVQVAASF